MEAMNFTSDQLSCLSCVDLRTLLSRYPADPAASPDPTLTSDTASEPAASAADRVASEAPVETSSVATPQNGHPTVKGGDQPQPAKADRVPTSAEEKVTPTGGDGVTAAESLKEEAEGADVTPSGGDVTEGSVEPAEAAVEDRDGSKSAPESRKRRLSGEPTEPVERKRKVSGISGVSDWVST